MGKRSRRSPLRGKRGVGRGARSWGVAEAGLASAAHDYLLLLGWRGASTAGFDRMGGGTRAGLEQACRGLFQLRWQQPWLFPRGGLKRVGELRQQRHQG